MGLKAAWKALLGRSDAVVIPPNYVHEPEPDGLERAATLDELAGQVHAHHAEITQLRLEWAETLDKFTAWANRQAARDRGRVQRAMKSMEPSEEDEGPPVSPQETLQLSGDPAGPPMNGRHHKADLYARIRRG